MRSVVFCCVGVILLLAVSPAFAIPTLDQSQATEGGVMGVGIGPQIAQTFTAGLSGVLDHIELDFPAPPSDTLTVSITDVSGGVPGSTILGSGSLAGHSPSGWVDVYFPSDTIDMSPGTMYAIVLSPATSSGYNIWTAGGSSYDGGQWCVNPGGSWIPISSYDLTFKTWVETNPGSGSVAIPLPGATTLCVMGLGFYGGLFRYRRKTQ